MHRCASFATTATLVSILMVGVLAPGAAFAQADLSDLFAPSTQLELDALIDDWAGRDTTPSQYAVERTTTSHGFALEEVRHEIGGLVHYGAIRYPHEFSTGGKFPVLVLLHGGFHGLDLNWMITFDELYPMTCLADSFIVVAPTYRGEILNGYGILPTRYSEGEPDPYDHDCDDAISLLTAVLENVPEADALRVAAMGGSRGGNIAYHVAMRDPRLRRTVVRYGPADFRLDHVQAGAREMIDTGETDDRMGELVAEHIAGPYLAGELTLKQARHKLLAWSVTPNLRAIVSLQIHHGALDDVVPIIHSEEFDAAMTTLGAGLPEYSLLVYPTGNHNEQSLPGYYQFVEDYLCALPATTDVSAAVPRPLLLRGAPNPFTGSVTLEARAGDGAKYAPGPRPVDVYDTRGRRVCSLELEPGAGIATVSWDGRDAAGRPVPAGVYHALLRGRDDATSLHLTRLR